MRLRILLAVAAALLVAMPLVATRAAADLVGLLEPGSRASLGLGGDPFRSPLRDECGWWDAAARGRTSEIRSAASIPVAARGRDALDLRTGEWRARVGEEWRLGSRTLRLGGDCLAPRSRTTWSGGSSSFETQQAVNRLEVAGRLEEAVPGVSLQVTAPIAWERGWSSSGALGAGLRVRFGTRGAAQLGWTRTRHDDAVRISASGNNVTTGLNLAGEQVAGDAGVGLLPWLSVEAGYRGQRWVPQTNAARSDLYSLAPSGFGGLWQTGARLRSGGTELLVRRTTGDLHGEGDARFDGLRFGRLTYVRGSLRSWLAGATWRGRETRVLLEGEQVHGEAVARATLESWPFTDLLVDLLGLRRTALARASLEEWRVHLGAERAGRSGRIRGGVSGYDLRPDARLTSWDSALFGIGALDVTQNPLPVRRVQLAAVSFGATRRLWNSEASVDVRQFVFARAMRDAAAGGTSSTSTSDSSAPVSPVSSAPRAHGWVGGTTLTFAIERHW
jgi:hypothetical protein